MKTPRLACTLGLLLAAAPSLRAEVSFARFNELSQKYCVECHNPADEKGSLDLAVFESEADFKGDVHLLEDLEWVIGEKEMPVPSAPKQPTNEERQEMVDWLVQTLMEIQNAMPNDPGEVAMPRISSKEFDYVIEDFTGKEYELSKFLTADTAGGEGFYNVGASQQLSVGQFEAFMGVGKMLMAHSRYVPGLGIWWMNGPEPSFGEDEELKGFLKENFERLVERDVLPEVVESHVREIKRATTYTEGFSGYLEAAYHYRYRHLLDMGSVSVEEVAQTYDAPLFPSSFGKLVAILGADRETPEVLEWRENPIMAELIQRWLVLPQPEKRDKHHAREEIKELSTWLEHVSDTRTSGGPSWREYEGIQAHPVDKPERQQWRGYYMNEGKGYIKVDADKVTGGSFHLAATGRTLPNTMDPSVIWVEGMVTMKNGDKLAWDKAGVEVTDERGRRLSFATFRDDVPGAQIKVDTPSSVTVRLPSEADTFEVSGMYDPSESSETRLLRVGAFDEQPDMDDSSLFLTYSPIGSNIKDSGVKKAFKAMGDVNGFISDRWFRYRFSLDDMFAHESETVREYMGVDPAPYPDARQNYWNNLYSISIQKMEEELAAGKAQPWMRQRYTEFREAIRAAANASFRNEAEALAEKRDILTRFAAKAWRGNISSGEVDELMALYKTEKELGSSTESALETAMRTALISPKFLYRFTESRQHPEPYRIAGPELATKLAFVLWSGLPDEELLALGTSGRILDPEVLSGQIDRLLADPKSDRFMEEFFGRWLHFADFDGFSGPDQEKFEEWNKRLAEAMHQEATLFVEYLVREDRPITDLFNANYTFLNAELAEHYGVSGVEGREMRLVQLDDPRRGGIMGMGAFLTKTSSPLRTSPVHRGLWLYEDVLDLPVPEPPPVPLLSDDGVDDQGRTIVDQLRQHRDDPACYSCHDRFDPMGVALENFDPIGRWRTRIEDKADVKSQGLFRSGETIDGVAGLRAYLAEREEILIDAFTTKLLGYALGRSVLPTDKPTLDAMKEAMSENNLSVRAALHAVIISPQFLTRRDVELASE